jgi:hypothetical protein
MRLRYLPVLLLSVLFFLSACKTTEIPRWESDYNYEGMAELDILAHIAAEKYLAGHYTGEIDPAMTPLTRISSVVTDTEVNVISIHFNNRFAEYPIRPALVAAADSAIRSHLPDMLQSFTLLLFSMDEPLFELIPNYYRDDPAHYDQTRLPVSRVMQQEPLIRQTDRPNLIPNGLDHRHIAVWHSHGWYYNQQLGRWKWQRPRLFRTVEDLLPMAFVLPYLAPMLESAGATVWMPRERDTQHHEVVVDNNSPSSAGTYRETQLRPDVTWQTGSDPGFAPPLAPLRGNENPFRMGFYRETLTDTAETASVEWVPAIPETGEYAVYVSYASSDSNTTAARYTVYHAGGETRFEINQRIGGGTWIYLGHFRFREGQSDQWGRVKLSNRGDVAGRRITADAVRFGGGMGIVERAGRTSGRSRFMEGARYYLQYAGMPDSLTWSLNENTNDYSDDFQSRGEWVNYLRGAPYGPNLDRNAGLGIPVELSLAFHTDAGVTRNDTVVGTLSIYSRIDTEDKVLFPDSMSRMNNRDLSDIMQTQIVDDIRARFDSTWTRRALRNSRYSESMRPNVPAVLLELLSHQNFRDMQFALDPRYRFDVARSIYKSMLRFVATQHGYEYVVQPLPVTHMRAEFVYAVDSGDTSHSGDSLRISWRPQPDPLEPSAAPDAYILYTRTEDGGFDNGRLVTDTTVVIGGLERGVIYSFKVRAANRGGAGFPSEVLAVSMPSVDQTNRPPVLIINGFTRISGPAVVSQPGFKGFADFLDAGVPDRYDIGFTGEQYNFNAWEPWIENDQPGHGSSHSDLETRIIPGNTFDFVLVHGRAIREAGYGFVSVSEAAIEAGLVEAGRYPIVNLMLGMQRQVRHQTSYADSLRGLPFGIYGPGMRAFLRDVAGSGGGIFVSGAHVGTDLILRPQPDSMAVAFAAEILGYTPTTNHASRTGEVFPEIYPASVANRGGIGASRSAASGRSANSRAATAGTGMQNLIPIIDTGTFRFNTAWHPEIYRVDAPDALKPAGNRGITLLRYNENEFSAAVGYRGGHRSVVFGFPFETIHHEQDRARVMKSVLEFLKPE